jgi:NAD(P)-dependent dehydrogenase (short-subunit alcohol dehydrogenase family)
VAWGRSTLTRFGFRAPTRYGGASIAANRLGTPEELAAACLYLCSAQAGFVSGQNLEIDGGSYAGLI